MLARALALALTFAVPATSGAAELVHVCLASGDVRGDCKCQKGGEHERLTRAMPASCCTVHLAPAQPPGHRDGETRALLAPAVAVLAGPLLFPALPASQREPELLPPSQGPPRFLQLRSLLI